MKLQVTKKAEHKFKKGYPLIQKEDLQQVPAPLPTDWLTLIDSKGQRLAEGYLGEQNKGIGWLLSWHGPINQSFFQQLFEISREKRTPFEKDSLTTAYRLFNGEGDGIGGVIIDRYADYAVFSWYNETLYQKKAELLTAFRTVYPDIIGAYEKIRFSTKDLPESQFLYGEQAPEPLLVTENGVQFATYLNEGLMTGIFLDQKEVRGRLVDGFAVGKTVLNMFSYTGAFSVIAASEASSTTSVDLANRSRSLTEGNFGLNAIDPKSQYIYVMDTFDFYKYAARHGHSYDTIVIDPPSFARNKKRIFSVQKDYDKLITGALNILSSEGTLLLCTNASVYPLKQFKNTIKKTLEESGVDYELTEVMGLPKDFKTHPHYKPSKYLKAVFVNIRH